MKQILTCLATTCIAALAFADDELKTKKVTYQHDGTTFQSSIVYPEDTDESKPGILMVPNWMGPTDESLEKAKNVADDDYVVMMVDMYGVNTRPSNSQEAGAAAGKVRDDRALMRARAGKALEVFRSEAEPLGLVPDNVAAIGFCFGGGTVLELGRAGADLDAIVSFHGDLASPTLDSDAGNTKAKVLVLHGADDPYVPQSDVQAFIDAMRDTDVDWILVQYGNAVHSFTNPSANSEGSRYDEQAAERAFEAMEELFEEVWDD